MFNLVIDVCWLLSSIIIFCHSPACVNQGWQQEAEDHISTCCLVVVLTYILFVALRELAQNQCLTSLLPPTEISYQLDQASARLDAVATWSKKFVQPVISGCIISFKMICKFRFVCD